MRKFFPQLFLIKKDIIWIMVNVLVKIVFKDEIQSTFLFSTEFVTCRLVYVPRALFPSFDFADDMT